MTLAITLVTAHGIWASTDHRLTEYPGGRLITDSSTKHVVVRCTDGVALISYTGLGRVGRIDLSAWMREVLRGEWRTVNATLVDLREQATARLGRQAHSLGVQHHFLVGAFLGGKPWAAEITNVQAATAISPAAIRPTFETTAQPVTDPLLLVGGSGRAAVQRADWDRLDTIRDRKPRDPKEFMQLLGDVNQRTAERQSAAARTVGRSSTVIFVPPSGNGGKIERYGPEDESHLEPPTWSVVQYGIDIHEAALPMFEILDAGEFESISDEAFAERMDRAMKAAIDPKGRAP